MKKTAITKLSLLALILAMSLIMMGCSSDDDDEADGLIYNQTAYRAQVNFIGIEVVNVNAGGLIANNSLEKNSTYLFQVTLFDSAGTVVGTIDSSLYVDDDNENQTINGTNCSWFISITENESEFTVLSAS